MKTVAVYLATINPYTMTPSQKTLLRVIKWSLGISAITGIVYWLQLRYGGYENIAGFIAALGLGVAAFTGLMLLLTVVVRAAKGQ